MRIVEKGEALNFQNSFCPHSHLWSIGHESWVMTERVRSQVQASEMGFLRRIEGVALFNKVRSSEIENVLTSSRYFSELKDLSLDGLTM